MDNEILYDIKRCLEDGLSCNDWKCIEEALEVISDYIDGYDILDDLDD